MNNAVKLATRGDLSEQIGFEVTVLFTLSAKTLGALKTAATLAADLNASPSYKARLK